MKKLLIIVALTSSIFANSQTKINIIVEKIDKTYSSFCPGAKIGSVFINKQEKILDIEGYQIPLEETQEIYVTKNGSHKGIKTVGYVQFSCKWNCIVGVDEDKLISGIGFGFTSKKEAYSFIELIYQLKKELLNE